MADGKVEWYQSAFLFLYYMGYLVMVIFYGTARYHPDILTHACLSTARRGLRFLQTKASIDAFPALSRVPAACGWCFRSVDRKRRFPHGEPGVLFRLGAAVTHAGRA
eukprot:83717-Prorocentrum_minimum.AAC.5